MEVGRAEVGLHDPGLCIDQGAGAGDQTHAARQAVTALAVDGIDAVGAVIPAGSARVGVEFEARVEVAGGDAVARGQTAAHAETAEIGGVGSRAARTGQAGGQTAVAGEDDEIAAAGGAAAGQGGEGRLIAGEARAQLAAEGQGEAVFIEIVAGGV